MSGVISAGPPQQPEQRLDVSALGAGTADHRAPAWWGTVLLLAIATVLFALLIIVYFYLRHDSLAWPPPRAPRPGGGASPAYPRLAIPLLNFLVIAGSAIPMYHADLAARRLDRDGVVQWSGLAVLLGVLALTLRFTEFDSLVFRWDANAYAATVWLILAAHLGYLAAITLALAVTWAWVRFKGLDTRRTLAVRCGAVAWWWGAVIWVLLFAVVYLVPRLA